MSIGTKISLKDSIATRMLLVILGLYLLVAITVTLSHVWMEYRYQKKNIIQDLGDIEQAFQNGLAVSLWGLDEQALKASVEGMLRIPTLVGVEISNAEKITIAIGGIVTQQNKTGEIGLHVNLSGCSDEDKTVHEDKLYKLEMFQRKFLITHNLEGENLLLGQTTIYSNSSVIYRRMKLQAVMLSFNVLLTLFTFSIALLWVINRYLRKPLEVLTNATENISLKNLGSFSIDAKTSRRNEIRVLEESMTSMVTNLHGAILKRDESEASLRQSEKRLTTIFNSSPDPIVVYNNQGYPEFINNAFNECFDWHLDELTNKNIPFVPKDQKEITKLKLKELYQSGDPVRFETTRLSKHGEVIDILLSAAVIKNIEGVNNGLVVNLKDITARKKLEAQLQQSQKMEAIGTLAGGIAHDFNNILFPILGHSEMLLQDIPENSPFKHGLHQIYKGALRASELVKQILTFSRHKTGELQLMKIQPIIKEALKLIRSTIPTTIEIKYDINPNCGRIKADPTQIHQIVMNLTTNAFHSMEKTGGELKVTLKEIELGEYDIITPEMEPGVYACLTVADTGMGIKKELTEKIFDPFFTTKETGKGTGMGLSVIHGIVKSMCGAIQVYSEPSRGSEFHVYLPVVKSLSQKQDIHQTKEPIQVGIEHILLVDDEDMVTTVVKEMLERLGYQVTSYTSSIEALKAFRINYDTFDLVITDMQMPNMPGNKLAIELTKIRPGIPILLCTGFSETMSEEKAASIGIKGFLLKPIEMKDLSQKIREVLDKKI